MYHNPALFQKRGLSLLAVGYRGGGCEVFLLHPTDVTKAWSTGHVGVTYEHLVRAAGNEGGKKLLVLPVGAEGQWAVVTGSFDSRKKSFTTVDCEFGMRLMRDTDAIQVHATHTKRVVLRGQEIGARAIRMSVGTPGGGSFMGRAADGQSAMGDLETLAALLAMRRATESGLFPSTPA